MKKYTIEIINRTEGTDLVEFFQLSRKHFTSREFKDYVLSRLFEIACEGCEYSRLIAKVRGVDKELFAVKCDTEADGSTIRSFISMARPSEVFMPLRTMTVAC